MEGRPITERELLSFDAQAPITGNVLAGSGILEPATGREVFDFTRKLERAAMHASGTQNFFTDVSVERTIKLEGGAVAQFEFNAEFGGIDIDCYEVKLSHAEPICEDTSTEDGMRFLLGEDVLEQLRSAEHSDYADIDGVIVYDEDDDGHYGYLQRVTSFHFMSHKAGCRQGEGSKTMIYDVLDQFSGPMETHIGSGLGMEYQQPNEVAQLRELEQLVHVGTPIMPEADLEHEQSVVTRADLINIVNAFVNVGLMDVRTVAYRNAPQHLAEPLLLD